MSDLRIGISGWTYAPWRGSFFPAELPQKEELAYASRQVNSIEINGTFYSLQRPTSYRAWREATPEDFRFSVKGPRFITHIKRLREVEGPLANFFGSGVLQLQEKLGPILWQTPPSLAFDAGVFDAFLEQLPRDTVAAASLARKHDTHLRFPDRQPPPGRRPLRHALEIRHPSFQCEEFLALLRRHEVALVVADTAGKWPLMEDITADFTYVRLHGDEKLYVSGYTPAALNRWARKVEAWRQGDRDVFVYFDNDVKTRAPFDAIALAKRLGLATPEAADVRSRSVKKPGPESSARSHWPAIRPRETARKSARPTMP